MNRDELERKCSLSSLSVPPNKTFTAEERSELTPDDILNILKQGNKEFTENNLTIRNNSARIRKAALGQCPVA
ncbi:MAG: carbonic anhydrase, partial [Acidobacteriota bacterium]|nr:carbonic anhydrase [Acidobacteriota bacterium]